MILIRKGAEADLYRHGKKLIKQRIAKGYRVPELDERIRTLRTRSEIKLLNKAREAGVDTPNVLSTGAFDLKDACEGGPSVGDRSEHFDPIIVMEYIDGPRVKDELSGRNYRGICSKIGKSIGTMHAAGIIHGDLTTSNMILQGSRVYFIDFGLGFISSSIEDQAVDLHLMSEALESTHHEIASKCFRVILRHYAKAYPKAAEAIKRLEAVESRGRYVKRTASKKALSEA